MVVTTTTFKTEFSSCPGVVVGVQREQEGAEHTALGDSVFNTRVEVEKTTDLNCLGSSIYRL